MELTTLFAYADRCRAEINALLTAHPELLHREFATTSPHNTIARLYAHSTAAEERWQARLTGEPLPEPYESRAPGTWEGLLADAEVLRDKTKALLSQQNPESRARVVEMSLRGTPYTLTVEECLFTIYNHEAWHRAQIYTALQQFGLEPPDLDYVLLKP